MSFFTVTCAWCGEDFTTGMVGRTMVGTGHECEVEIPCAEPGCDRPSEVEILVAPAIRELRCTGHIHGGAACQWRTGRTSALPPQEGPTE